MRVPDELELPAQLVPRRDGAAQRPASGKRHHHLRHGTAERSPTLHGRQTTSGKLFCYL